MKITLLSLTSVLCFCSCSAVTASDYLKSKFGAQTPDYHMELTPVAFNDLDGWEKSDVWKGFKAFSKSCQSMLNRPANNSLTAYAGTYHDWRAVCEQAIKLETITQMDTHSAIPRSFFEDNFIPYLITDNGNPEGQFTGYYEAQLNGSRTKKAPYIYPVYKLPEYNIGHLDRQKIDGGALKKQALEIAYVDDPVELFFLHVQGSGRILLDDGSTLRIGYAGQNGHSYISIGRHLVDQGIFTLENITAEKIKTWLRENPNKMMETLHINPSYIFFRTLEGEGPIGAQGIALTPLGSIAVDKRFIPYGSPLWVNTTTDGETPFSLLATAQDTGGAIKGVIRGDIFFGYGKEAQHGASGMKHAGTAHILLPKNIQPTVDKWRSSNNPPQ